MKSYKQRTMDACRKMIDLYENPREDHLYFRSLGCPFCKMYWNENNCHGCFMANEWGDIGCFNFLSYYNAHAARFINSNSLFDGITRAAFKLRAQFFREMLVELEQYPARQFTPSGWRYFDIDRGR